MTPSGRTFLVECYEPGVVEADVAAAGTRARHATSELRRAGRDVSYLGALLVAGDEAVFHAFRASEPTVVEAASRSATLPFERIVEAVGVQGDGFGLDPESLLRPAMDRSGHLIEED